MRRKDRRGEGREERGEERRGERVLLDHCTCNHDKYMVISYVGEEWEGSANNPLPLTVGHHVLEYLFISPLGGRGKEGKE